MNSLLNPIVLPLVFELSLSLVTGCRRLPESPSGLAATRIFLTAITRHYPVFSSNGVSFFSSPNADRDSGDDFPASARDVANLVVARVKRRREGELPFGGGVRPVEVILKI